MPAVRGSIAKGAGKRVGFSVDSGASGEEGKGTEVFDGGEKAWFMICWSEDEGVYLVRSLNGPSDRV